MFERFTERASKVVVLAQEEARRFNHNYIGTEHLLLGLLREDEGVAAHALSSFNVTLDEVRERVVRIAGNGKEGVDQAPFTLSLKKVLGLALQEASRLGRDHVGAEHILLGLVREPGGTATRVLFSLNTPPEAVRRRVIRMLGDDWERPVLDVAHQEGPEDTLTLMVKARVKEIEVHVHCGVGAEERALPQKLLVDLEYVYEARGADDVSGVVDYGVLLEGVAQVLEREEFRLLETGARMVGEHVLERFPAVRRVTVTVTKVRVPVARTVSGVSVEATFVR